ncbi:hypothetical protein BH11PSE7_BH11PSE7_22810 [soil metagenome]
MSNAQMLLEPVVSAMDSLGIAACVFNDDDTTLLWNRTFLQYFPEHDGLIHPGEHYREKLRRFYEARLAGDQLDHIDEHIAAGVARHQSQHQPFSFEHRGLLLKVASLPIPHVGRIRIWTADTSYSGHAGPSSAPAPLEGGTTDAGASEAGASETGAGPDELWAGQTGLFRHLADGIMMLDETGHITWVNDQFHLMYGLPDTAMVAGMRFEDIYAHAWRDAHHESAEPYLSGAATLADNLRFAGAPFQLPLPEGRWVRVIGQRGPQGMGYYSHVDITVPSGKEKSCRRKPLCWRRLSAASARASS